MTSTFNDASCGADRPLAAQHRIGTPPFMAIDLLNKNPLPHLYRHELESLFYIILWGALHPTSLEVVKAWEQTLESNEMAKETFFAYSNKAKTIFDAIRPEFQGLRKEWIEPLYRLIRDALRSVPDQLEGPIPDDYDYETYDGRLTFWTFMAAIKQTPRWAEKESQETLAEAEEKKKEETKPRGDH
ncbi:hypothetical protein MD484_g3737, partial [Candolleomyces efflorescens]